MEKIKAEERRNRIQEILEGTTEPVSGSRLAKTFGVSRQVIVTDIAILKSRLPDIISTARGYILMREHDCRCVFKVLHTEEQTADELLCIVERGGTVLDVYVDHRVYGTIKRPLDIRSRRDVDTFLEDLKTSVSTPLMKITSGYHFHTVEARSEAILKEIEEALRERGYLIEVIKTPTIYEPKNYGK